MRLAPALLLAALATACGTSSPSTADASLDATDATSEDVTPVVPAAEGFRVSLTPAGRVHVEAGGVSLGDLDVVLRSDDSERSIGDMQTELTASGDALTARANDGWTVTLRRVEPAAGAVRLAWSVAGAGTFHGLSLRSADVGLPADAHVVMDGAQSWSFTGPLSLSPGAVRPRDAAGRVVWPATPGDVSVDAAGIGYFRGDLTWSRGGLSVCAEAPFERWTAILAERPASAWRLHVATGVIADDAATLTANGPPVEGAWTLTAADPTRPFACSDVATPASRVRAGGPFPRGWWSWNTLFEDVTAAQVEAQVAPMRSLDPRADHVTVDDGWERAWGDWRERDGFGSTLAELATRLRARGVTLGLWLAPFAVDPAAPLATEHPDWLVRATDGSPLRAPLVPGREYFVLDVTVPAAREHLTRVFASLRASGVTLFKIDFLFAAALPGVRADRAATGLQAYRLGLEAIVAGAGDAHVNGCGALILPSVPFVDSLRVGADNTFSGTPPFWAAVAASARNLATRAPHLRRWGVVPDPDQPVVRGLTRDEGAAFLAVGALSAGAFGYGDDLTAAGVAGSEALTSDPGGLRAGEGRRFREVEALDLASAVGGRFAVSPLIDGALHRFQGTAARPPSIWRATSDAATVVVVFNWLDAPQEVTVPASALTGEVTGADRRVDAGWVVTVAPHATRVLTSGATRP